MDVQLIEEEEEVELTVDEAFKQSGGLGIYQILRIILAGLVFTGSAVFIYSLPFFEHAKIRCTLNGIEFKDCKLKDPCDHSHMKYEFEDEYEETIIAQFDIVCRDDFLGWIGTAYMIGLMFGSYLFGILSETIGRRYSICIGESCNIIGSIIFVFTRGDSQWMLILGGLIIGTGNGTWAPAYNLAFDVLLSAKVELSLSAMNCIFALSEVVLASFMYIHHSWRVQMYFIIGWYTLGLIILLLMGEGPRFLLIQKKEQKAIEFFRKIAKYNRKGFPSKVKISIQGAETGKKQKGFWDIFRYKAPRWRFLLLCPQLLTAQFVYFAIGLAMANLGGNIQINTILGGVFESLGYFSTSILVNTRLFGRKYTLLIFYIFASLGFVMQIILSAVDAPQYTIIIMVILRKFGISGAINVLFLFASELFASEVRSSVMSVLNVMGGIGSLLAPMIVELSSSDYIFAGFCIVTTIAVLPFPETRGKELMDTMGDDETKGNSPGELNTERQAAVDNLYLRFEKGKGFIDLVDLRAMCNFSGTNKIQVEDDFLQEEPFFKFLQNSGHEISQGTVNREEWNNYYEIVSANIQKDEAFMLQLKEEWKLD